MPIFSAYGVACDACGAQTQTLYDTAQEAEDAAEASGWYVSAAASGPALCPDCDGENE